MLLDTACQTGQSHTSAGSLPGIQPFNETRDFSDKHEAQIQP
jgi:hypothetical protein